MITLILPPPFCVWLEPLLSARRALLRVLLGSGGSTRPDVSCRGVLCFVRGSVVNVNPGGIFGVEGQGSFGGEGQGTGAGSSRADGATILSSKGSITLRSLSGSLARVSCRGRGVSSPTFVSSSHKGWHTTRRTATSMAGLGAHQCHSRGQCQPAGCKDHSSQDREDVLPPPLQLTRSDGWGRRHYLLRRRGGRIAILLKAGW